MHRLVNDDAQKGPKTADGAEPRAPKEAEGGGKAVKIALAVALFAASAVILYKQGVFGAKEDPAAAPQMDAATVKQFQEDQKRAEQISRDRQKAVDEGRAPKPITSQNN